MPVTHAHYAISRTTQRTSVPSIQKATQNLSLHPQDPASLNALNHTQRLTREHRNKSVAALRRAPARSRQPRAPIHMLAHRATAMAMPYHSALRSEKTKEGYLLP